MATGRRNKLEIIHLSQVLGDRHSAGLSAIALALSAVVSLALLEARNCRLMAAEPSRTAAQDPIENDDDPRVKAAVVRAANFLRHNGTPSQVGELSLSINALAKIRSKYPDLIPADDPVLQELVAALRARCLPRFQASRQGGHDNYEAGCAAMALAAVNRTAYAAELRSIAEYLLKKQLPNGAWSYMEGMVPIGAAAGRGRGRRSADVSRRE